MILFSLNSITAIDCNQFIYSLVAFCVLLFVSESGRGFCFRVEAALHRSSPARLSLLIAFVHLLVQIEDHCDALDAVEEALQRGRQDVLQVGEESAD